jgi:lysyl-tRNA synthetase class 1
MSERRAGAKKAKPDWVAQTADRVLRRVERDGHEPTTDEPVVCASGVSPSGPIHLGNLRELMVPHFVVEEINSRGVPCEHIVSWDDYDRLRKVPVGAPASFVEHIGRPLSAVPDPLGELDSWADRFRTPFLEALGRLGVVARNISQTERYTSGAYRRQIVHAIEHRAAVNAVLERYRTLEPPLDEAAEAGTEILGGDGVEAEVLGDGYWPYKVYCRRCGRDTTTIVETAADGDSYWIEYRCDCGHHDRFDLAVENHGKLVWKVDWPMRWAYERVAFEAGGADHSSPGSSFTVGSDLVASIFDGRAPEYLAYSFVGIRGMGKMSSSAGAVPTPSDALEVLETPILRWMYVRKNPRQGITVDLGSGIHALYDEWDALTRKIDASSAAPGQVQTWTRAARTRAVDAFPAPDAVVPFRTLASAVSVAAGDAEQTARIVGELTDVPSADTPRTEPRLGLAAAWIERFAPDEERITVRVEPDRDRLASLSDLESTWISLLTDHLDDDWSLDGLKSLVYGVPKLAAGLPLDSPPTDELKRQQREFFKLLYQLLISSDTGPRVPTLLLAVGRDEVLRLVQPSVVSSG